MPTERETELFEWAAGRVKNRGGQDDRERAMQPTTGGTPGASRYTGTPTGSARFGRSREAAEGRLEDLPAGAETRKFAPGGWPARLEEARPASCSSAR